MNALNLLAALGDHLWQSTIFAAVAALLVLMLKQNHARIRYALWVAASIKFLVPLALLSNIGSQFEAIRHPSLVQPAAVATLAQWSEPFGYVEVPIAIPIAAQPAATRTARWPQLLLTLWLTGFVVVGISSYWRWRRVARLVNAATPLAEGMERDLMQRLEARHRLSLMIPIVATTSMIEPGLFGILRPRLLLPINIREHVNEEQLEAILDHEISHAVRRDNLWATLHMITEALFWFHPLIWWIGSRLVDERERACDEDVLRRGFAPDAYAQAMVEICKWCLVSPVKCVSGVTGSDLKKRIEAIMTNGIAQNLELGKKLLLATVAIAAIAGPILVGLLNAPQIHAQTSPGPIPKWEVVSVKPCTGQPAPGGARGGGPGSSGPAHGVLNIPCNTLASFIDYAYFIYANARVNPPSHVPVSGGPDWINSEFYQVTAKVDGEATQEMMWGPMLQSLLEDRFSLKVHRETREVAAYALTVVKGGHKLQPTAPGSCISLDTLLATLKVEQVTPGERRPPICNAAGGGRAGPNLSRRFNGTNLTSFAEWLRGMVDRPVIDKTGLTGGYDFNLAFTLDDSTPGLSSAMPPLPPNAGPGAVTRREQELTHAGDPAGPSIFTALQEQLGLRLDPIRGPGEFFVIDSALRPKPN